MSMLAGPRRKQKVINLRAKNNAWSNDSTKFGQRMLEKMGWSSGKGLGARENGTVEHVVARYKNDERGLGFDDKNDQWTKHEDDFNALLANLSNDDGKELKLHSGVSLEEKSKKSKARIHYHKFTRGKDLSKYSEKDLANIFGKKSLTHEKTIEEVKDDVPISEQVFTEKGSMVDYFKSKLNAFKSKCQISLINDELSEDAEYGFKGFPANDEEEIEESHHQGIGFQSFSLNSFNYTVDIERQIDKNEEQNQIDKDMGKASAKKSKKKKKSKNKDKEHSEVKLDSVKNHTVTDTDFNHAVEELEKDLLTKKVKKSKKRTSDKVRTAPESTEPESEPQPEQEPLMKKKKKSKKETLEVPECTDDTENSHVLKRKKKKKNKEIAN